MPSIAYTIDIHEDAWFALHLNGPHKSLPEGDFKIEADDKVWLVCRCRHRRFIDGPDCRGSPPLIAGLCRLFESNPPGTSLRMLSQGENLSSNFYEVILYAALVEQLPVCIDAVPFRDCTEVEFGTRHTLLQGP